VFEQKNVLTFKLNFLALDIPVTRHQTAWHQAGFLRSITVEIAFVSLKAYWAKRRLWTAFMLSFDFWTEWSIIWTRRTRFAVSL